MGLKTTSEWEREHWVQYEFTIALCPCQIETDWRNQVEKGKWHVETKIRVLIHMSGTWTEPWIATWKLKPTFQNLCACCQHTCMLLCLLCCVRVGCSVMLCWWILWFLLQLGRSWEKDECLSRSCTLPRAKQCQQNPSCLKHCASGEGILHVWLSQGRSHTEAKHWINPAF